MAQEAVYDITKSNKFRYLNIEDVEAPTNKETTIIQYILRNTPEVNIHRMRGEAENKVFTKKDPNKGGCYEAVFYNKLLFNSTYAVMLQDTNIALLRKSSDHYYDYFNQIIVAAGFEARVK